MRYLDVVQITFVFLLRMKIRRLFESKEPCISSIFLYQFQEIIVFIRTTIVGLYITQKNKQLTTLLNLETSLNISEEEKF